MANRRIADLHAALTWDLADFDKGTSRIEAGFGALRDRAVKLASDIRNIGRTMTIGLTVPIAASAAGFSVAALSMANDSRGMQASANVAGEGFEKFQRQSYAASQAVGMEFTKLGDIFKDTKDKVGDFIATGQGEMADFFEKIAPKVGLTAEAFKELSGKDALQLYYNSLVKAGVSSSEMTFYMEAIASDAAMLIPLLEKNGQLFDEWGAKANVTTPEQAESLKNYRDAVEALQLSLGRILFAIVDSGLLDSVASLVNRFADFVTGISETNPGLIRFAGYALLAVAAMGPLIMVLTALAITVLPLFLVRLGPIYALLSAMINPIGTAALILAKLSGGFAGLIARLGGAIPLIGRMLAILIRLNPVAAAVITIFTLFGDKIAASLGRVWDVAQATLGPAMERLIASVSELFTELGRIFDTLAASPVGRFLSTLIAIVGELVGIANRDRGRRSRAGT